MPSRLFVFMLIILLSAGCASKGKGELDDEKFDGLAAAQLYEQGKTQMDKKNYELALENYDKLLARYPFSKEAQQAQLDTIEANYEMREIDSAIIAAEDFIKNNPRHPRVDYAWYLKGKANQRRYESFLDKFVKKDYADLDAKSMEEAFEDYKTLIKRFPNSQYADDAKQRMIFLRNTLARHELNIARHYAEVDAWVAVANRCQSLLENFDRTDSVPDALALLAKAYKELGAVESRQETLKMLRTNFPALADNYKDI